MPDYCYTPVKGGKMLMIHFENNLPEETNFEGGWTEALEMNRIIGVSPNQTISMYICYLFQQWHVYEYLCGQRLAELVTIMLFITALVRTPHRDFSHKLNTINLFPEKSKKEVIQ